ncbi:MAG TPA: hypothetical protein VFV93_17435 [Thermomicrobiales bacterium]|nr:hypothetical protein [Thermomicrobiales bacterium]
MVLVRKTELACRNSWDQDLWELADQPMDIPTSAHVPLPLSGSEPQDFPIVRAEVADDDAARAGEMFTDRITSISMPTRSQLRPGRQDADQIEATDGTDTEADLLNARSSVREARKRRQEQRHQERRKHQETVLQRADDLLDTTEPANENDRDLARIRAVDGPMTTGRERKADRQPETREQHTGGDRPVQPRRPVGGEQTPVRREPVPAIEFSAVDPVFETGPTAPPAPQPDSKAAPAKKVNGAGSSAFKRGETEPLPSPAEILDAARQRNAQLTGEAEAPAKREASARVSSARPAEQRPARSMPGDLPPAVESRPTRWFTGAGHLPGERKNEIAAPFPVDPIDLASDLKTVRRCCATCRDFKQIGDGRTGWCNNPYAFKERRMVQSDELACRSSLGVWWLPHDDLWLEYADTTHHGRPTPLLDDLVGAVADERQRMGQRSSR